MAISALTKGSMVTLMMMIFIIPQSFMSLKLPFLGAVLLFGVVAEGAKDRWRIRSGAFLPYYLIFCLLTVTWCIIGLVRGNAEIAILETLRVYVVYMGVYCALTIYVSNLDYQAHIDRVVVAGAIGIGAVALYTLLDHIFHLGWLPQSVKDDMYLQVGLHDGYVQMNNVNIGMLTFIVPYLLSRLLLGERKDRHAYLLPSLVIAVIAAILASRRVVLILLLLTPLLAFVVSVLAGQATHKQQKRFVQFYFLPLLAAGGGAWLLFYLGSNLLEGFTDRVLSAFTTDPDAPRPLQHAALMAGFSDSYLWGSGFGGLTPVIRSDERPWTYELTYSRLLFNAGLLGFGTLMLFFSSYLFLVLRKIRGSSHASVHVSMLVGFFSVLIASASNPYLTSFDYLFPLSIIPLILNTRTRPIQRSVEIEALP
jgi:hypothetical protein